MGFLDFFKKKQEVEIKPEPKKVNFKDLSKTLEDLELEGSNKVLKIFESISEIIQSSEKDLISKVQVLEKIDVDSFKEVGKTKRIVKQSLENYIRQVYILNKEITNIKKENIEDFIIDLNKIFHNFEKNSNLFYGRSTFLIGDELVEVRKEIKNLLNNISNIIKENKEVVNDLKKISKISSNKKGLDEKEIEIEKITTEEKSIEKSIEKSKQEVQDVISKIKEIKDSPEYNERNKNLEKINHLEKAHTNKILSLKSKIDFKKLSHVHHSSSRDIQTIKEFKENFKETLEKSGADNLLKLLEEARIDSPEIKNKLEEIKKTKEEIKENQSNIKNDETIELNSTIKSLEATIESSNSEKENISKRKELLNSSKGKILSSIKDNAKSLNLVIN